MCAHGNNECMWVNVRVHTCGWCAEVARGHRDHKRSWGSVTVSLRPGSISTHSLRPLGIFSPFGRSPPSLNRDTRHSLQVGFSAEGSRRDVGFWMSVRSSATQNDPSLLLTAALGFPWDPRAWGEVTAYFQTPESGPHISASDRTRGQHQNGGHPVHQSSSAQEQLLLGPSPRLPSSLPEYLT